MPFDPPYPTGTVIAGIQFKPRMLDVRFFLSISQAPIKNLELTIQLINTSGQLLSIQALGQLSPLTGVTVVPVLDGPNSRINSVQVTDGKTNSTIPLGAATPLGTLEERSDSWRIHCNELLQNAMEEFVLMVDQPYRTKMIEGFLVNSTYDYSTASGSKTGKLWNVTKFDDSGIPYLPTQQEVQAILKYKPPNFTTEGIQIDLSGKPIVPTATRP
jgi:hypothetical protein